MFRYVLPFIRWSFALAIGAGVSGAEASSSHARVRIGLFGGGSLPIAQDDGRAGPFYGLRTSFVAGQRLGLEASITVIRHADGRIGTSAGTVRVRAPHVTTHAAGATYVFWRRAGARVYFEAETGWARVGIPGDARRNATLFGAGVGIDFGLGAIALRGDVRPRFLVTSSDGASRKSVGVLAGVHYGIE